MSAKRGIEDVRDALFKALDGLQDEKNPMEIERVKAVCDVADQLIKSAKVEIDFLRVAGGVSTGFIKPGLGAPSNGQESGTEGRPGKSSGPRGAIGGVTRHLLGG